MRFSPSVFTSNPGPFSYLCRLRELAKKMEADEPSKSKLEWVSHGEILTIGHVEVSAHALKEAVAQISSRMMTLLENLTFHANLNFETAWLEDQRAEKVDNNNSGFSPIEDRSATLLSLLSKSHEISKAPFPSPAS